MRGRNRGARTPARAALQGLADPYAGPEEQEHAADGGGPAPGSATDCPRERPGSVSAGARDPAPSWAVKWRRRWGRGRGRGLLTRSAADLRVQICHKEVHSNPKGVTDDREKTGISTVTSNKPDETRRLCGRFGHALDSSTGSVSRSPHQAAVRAPRRSCRGPHPPRSDTSPSRDPGPRRRSPDSESSPRFRCRPG